MEIENNSENTPEKINRKYTDLSTQCTLLSGELKIPLTKIKYEVKITGGIAKIRLKQFYKNEFSDKNLNIKYRFPLSNTAVFDGFTAEFKDKRIRGVIKEKEIAKREFKILKSAGHFSAYAEKCEESEDIMEILLGNFPANSTLKINFSFIQRLELFNNDIWHLKIFSTLTPSFNQNSNIFGFNNNKNFKKSMGDTRDTKKSQEDRNYTWEIEIEVLNCENYVENIFSESHENCINILRKSNGDFFCDIGQYEIPDRDFVLSIKNRELFCNLSYLTQFNDFPDQSLPRYASLLQFIPSICQKFDSKNEFYQFLKSSTLAEFIFIIDFSDSMMGERLRIAIESTIYFIKLLPKNAKINIIKFGFSPQILSQTHSLENSDKNFEIFSNFLSQEIYSLGGDDLLEALRKSLEIQRFKKYQRNLILLTDGDVDYKEETYQEIELSCLYKQSRVFTIGIGNGYSDSFIKKSGKLGRGTSTSISSQFFIKSRIETIFLDTLTPSLTDFNVTYDEDYVAAVAPVPNIFSHITRGEPFTMFVLLKNSIERKQDKTTEISVEYYDSIKRHPETRKFILDVKKSVIGDSSIHKLCVDQIIKNLRYIEKHCYLSEELPDDGTLAVRLSTGYQVMCSSDTAFVCKIDSRVFGKFIETEEQVISNILSIDYKKKEEEKLIKKFSALSIEEDKERMSDGRGDMLNDLLENSSDEEEYGTLKMYEEDIEKPNERQMEFNKKDEGGYDDHLGLEEGIDIYNYARGFKRENEKPESEEKEFNLLKKMSGRDNYFAVKENKNEVIQGGFNDLKFKRSRSRHREKIKDEKKIKKKRKEKSEKKQSPLMKLLESLNRKKNLGEKKSLKTSSIKRRKINLKETKSKAEISNLYKKLYISHASELSNDETNLKGTLNESKKLKKKSKSKFEPFDLLNFSDDKSPGGINYPFKPSINTSVTTTPLPYQPRISPSNTQPQFQSRGTYNLQPQNQNYPTQRPGTTTNFRGNHPQLYPQGRGTRGRGQAKAYGQMGHFNDSYLQNVIEEEGDNPFINERRGQRAREEEEDKQKKFDMFYEYGQDQTPFGNMQQIPNYEEQQQNYNFRMTSNSYQFSHQIAPPPVKNLPHYHQNVRKSSKDSLIKEIKKTQKNDGSWDYSQEILQKLGIMVRQFNDLKAKLKKGKQFTMTFIVYIWLYKKFWSDPKTMDMRIRAEGYLKEKYGRGFDGVFRDSVSTIF